MKNFLAIATVLFLVACSQNEAEAGGTCQAELIPDCNCLQVYEPVCGCDKKTYPNSCFAECSSIMTYTEGECP